VTPAPDTLGQGVDDLINTLGAQFPKASRANVEDAIARALLEALEVEDVPTSEVECVRDYGVPCPEAWVDGGDGTSCFAPTGYRGACPQVVRYGDGMTPEAKREQASACGAQFPSVGACTADYSELCPAGWTVEGEDCVAPVGYLGPCVARKQFHGFNWAEKKLWGDRCQVRWPCRQPRGHVADAQE
jgi:CPW-WPC domain-containing protein